MSNPSRRRLSLFAALSATGLSLGCGAELPVQTKLGLRLNEVVSNNEGVFVDEYGEADDYIEVINASDERVNLSNYLLRESSGEHALPDVDVEPGAVTLLWSDDAPEQGLLHLPFKVSASGERLQLLQRNGVIVDDVLVPPLDEHHAYLRIPDATGDFVDCGWATPSRENGAACGPLPRVDPEDISFPPYAWAEPWPSLPLPLVITEAALHPAQFVEVLNSSEESVELGEFQLNLAPHSVGLSWPTPDVGSALGWPQARLAAGERVSVAVSNDDVRSIADGQSFEGVLSLWRIAAQAAPELTDRLDFVAWPAGATLSRFPDLAGQYRFCKSTSPGLPNDECAEVTERPFGDRARQLLSEADFTALAAGRGSLGAESVEFVIDLRAGGVVAFLNSANWDLHYSFVREQIQGLPHLDRCDPVQLQEFYTGWYAFSAQEYFKVEGRRYLLGTLVRHAGSGLHTLQFSPGDAISAEQMKQAFYSVMRRVWNPKDWFIRPQTPDQIARIEAIAGQVPIVGPNAPFRGVEFQPLTPALAFGTLRFVAAEDLRAATLGPRDIVVTDQVPNDIPLIGGLITQAFQTPLAHVNILSRGRGTPNMALANAATHGRLLPYFGKLVRFEVSAADFSLELADPAAALSFWESRKPTGPRLEPRVDLSVRGVQPLAQRSFADLPSIGGKAAQLAELGKVALCAGPVAVPDSPIAVPVVHSIEHLEASGARALLEELRGQAAFQADPQERSRGLARVQALILQHPLHPQLVEEVVAWVAEHWPQRALRFRSSSNAEDLAGFNGAGLYTSIGVEDGSAGPIADAIRGVWASLWNSRAYDERAYYNFSDESLGMAVLVHSAFKSERANGVAVSRDVTDPSRADRYYINAQIGEALVTNPAPGVRSDEFSYSSGDYLPFVYYDHSSLSSGEPVLTAAETAYLTCNLTAIHRHFQPILDPKQDNHWFAMDIEFKLMGDERRLAIKQARPYSFGRAASSGWCDF